MSPVSRWTFGDITVDCVPEFQIALQPPARLYPDSTPEAIEAHRPWLEPNLLDPASGKLWIAFHTFVVRTPRHVVLLDACSGNDKPRPQKPHYHMNAWPYLERLAAIGVKPEDVDYVLCTHLHVDHVGWNTRLVEGRWVPTFPNARYLFSGPEWEFWEHEYKQERFKDDPYYLDSILPVIEAGRVDLVKLDHVIEAGRVWLDPTPGHTPGHVCLHVAGGGRDAVMSGDLMHTALQRAEPDWSSCFCVDPAHSRRTRRAFLERYADTDTLVMPAHFPAPTVGHVVRHGRAYRFRFEGEG